MGSGRRELIKQITFSSPLFRKTVQFVDESTGPDDPSNP
jgi:hypothetical protein